MVKLFMDFDSTITEDSTLMQLYLRLPKDMLRKATSISNKDYYRYEEPLTRKCFSNLILTIRNSKNWEECSKQITIIMLDYSKMIKGIELKGMNLIENCIKHLDTEGLARAASQIRVREGFESFIGRFERDLRYIISFNWSDQLIRMKCPEIPSNNIISNSLRFRRNECLGFYRNRIVLTPEHKFSYFNKLKDKINIFCGDSLPDLLPCLYSDLAFAFNSHDKEFLSICDMIREKFSRQIYIVNNFNEASHILSKFSLV